MKVTRFVHVNVVCSDLDRSLAFYTQVLGATVHQRLGSGEADLRAALGVGSDGAREYRAALVYWAGNVNGPYVDLLEWRRPHGAPAPRRPAGAQDLGMARVCLEVEDVDVAVADLQAAGIPLLGPPERMESGPWTLRVIACHDPDGTLVELIDFPRGASRRAGTGGPA